MRFRLTALSLLFVAVAVAGVWTRQASPAQLAFQAARNVEVVDRDLKKAVVRYRDVVSTYPKDRVVVPEALLALANCLEQLGQPPEALAAYERVVKEYPDTPPAKEAQKKLAAFAKEGSGLTITLVDVPTDGAPSFVGGFMSFTDPDTGLAVSDLKSGRTRLVTESPLASAARQLAFESAPSPDGKLIAYWSGEDRGELPYLSSLRVISSSGDAPPRVLCCADPSPQIQSFDVFDPFGWSWDSKQVLFTRVGGNAPRATQIMTVPAGGGVPRVLKTIEGSVKRASWSPDGQFIIYDAPRVVGTPEHALFIMRSDGSNSSVLIPHTSHDEMLDWFPDGKRILFVSDRMGANAAFMQRVADGKAVGEPILLKENLGGMVEGQGFTRDGSYYYNTRSLRAKVLTFGVDASGSVSGAERLPSRFANGQQGAAWSPDGSQMAYVQDSFGSGTRPTLSIQSVASGLAHTVPLTLDWIANPAWMPDGLSVIVEGTTGQGGQGLFQIELAGGTVSRIGETTTEMKRFPVVSPDGREVIYMVGRTSIQARDLSVGTVRSLVEGVNLTDFALSPDGRSIAVQTARGKDLPPVQIIPIGRGTPFRLGAETGVRPPGIAWSPDSQWVWFADYRTPNMPLWRAPVNGGPAQHLSVQLPGTRMISRLSAAPDGSMAVSGHIMVFEQWVMRNIPPAAK